MNYIFFQFPQTSKSKKNLSWLQVFRGVASIVVLLHHISASTNFYFHSDFFSNIFKPGWFGVDFFFVLSGFIITYIHKKDLGNRKTLKSYFLKRFSRIYPIYWIAALLSIYPFINRESDYLIKSLLLLPQNEMPFLGVAWSLVYEVFFYLMFALFIYAGRRPTIIIISLYILFIITTQVYSIHFSNPFFATIGSAYNIEFILGCLTAILFQNHQFPHSLSLLFLSLFFTGILWYLSMHNVISKITLEARLFYGFTFSALTYTGAILSGTSTKKFPFLLLIGDASYSIYLFHPIVLAIIYKISSGILVQPNVTFLGVFAFFVSLFTGLFIHLFIERRLVYYSNSFSHTKNSI